jgi:hypothetical protein
MGVAKHHQPGRLDRPRAGRSAQLENAVNDCAAMFRSCARSKNITASKKVRKMNDIKGWRATKRPNPGSAESPPQLKFGGKI